MKHITGETFMLPALKQSSTIAEVKAAFRDMAGIPPDHQCLAINGKTAEDDKTLDVYGVYHELYLRFPIRADINQAPRL